VAVKQCLARSSRSRQCLCPALGSLMQGWERSPAPKCQPKHCPSLHLSFDFQVDPDSHFSILMLFEHLSKVRVTDDQNLDELCIALLCAHPETYCRWRACAYRGCTFPPGLSWVFCVMVLFLFLDAQFLADILYICAWATWDRQWE